MKGWLIVCLLLFALPANATQDRWPALYNVSGVAADDVLNVRSEPNAGAPIVGTLAADTRDVELIRPNDRQTWALVNIGERSGWVSLAFLQRQPGQWYGAAPDTLWCAGTEPFWSFKVDAGKITYESQDTATQMGRIDATTQSHNHTGRHAIVGIFERSGDGPYLDSLALLANEVCGDGMSDREYGFALDLILGNMNGFVLQSGCCSLTR
ncbi:SH3 domain-containing protein [Sulfitobacter aestuariivivens]|uniref:SH3 domain-containing protein n=1 Tax=Sulfitobacter aestuariivivens TaxID=2766981 RepID=A0A927HG98_9RHOB|nr:SH3 domain-containing protein [Sulfitobacter aestuariivivens]MBD3665288.1 SH3 domain-containing protein [Sulfitobacter aestuariivivens]